MRLMKIITPKMMTTSLWRWLKKTRVAMIEKTTIAKRVKK